MHHDHPFRFAVAPDFTSPTQWTETARRVEALGFSTILTSDHPGGGGGPGPISTLMMAAAATTTLRLGTHVLANDFRNPVMLAQEVATLDVLSGERLEFGLGTGWSRDDYAALGISFDSPGTRVGRLEEAITLMKRLFREDAVTFSGVHYTAHNAQLNPKPANPRPPLFIGGGGKRILSLAAREADIVSFDPKGTAAGPKDLATATPSGLSQQIGWVREAAGRRFDALELHLLVYSVMITAHRRQAAEQIATFVASVPPSVMINTQMSIDDVLESPRFLIGTVDEIVEQLLAHRREYGISYITTLHFPGFADVETFSPVVARLAGT